MALRRRNKHVIDRAGFLGGSDQSPPCPPRASSSSQSRSVKGAKDASCYFHQLPPCKSPCRRECGRFLVLMHFAWGFFLSAMFRPGAMLYLHTFSAYLVTRTHFSEGLEVSRHHPWLFRNALLAPIHSCGLTDHLLT